MVRLADESRVLDSRDESEVFSPSEPGSSEVHVEAVESVEQKTRIRGEERQTRDTYSQISEGIDASGGDFRDQCV
jgi:hypothetical protein